MRSPAHVLLVLLTILTLVHRPVLASEAPSPADPLAPLSATLEEVRSEQGGTLIVGMADRTARKALRELDASGRARGYTLVDLSHTDEDEERLCIRLGASMSPQAVLVSAPATGSLRVTRMQDCDVRARARAEKAVQTHARRSTRSHDLASFYRPDGQGLKVHWMGWAAAGGSVAGGLITAGLVAGAAEAPGLIAPALILGIPLAIGSAVGLVASVPMIVGGMLMDTTEVHERGARPGWVLAVVGTGLVAGSAGSLFFGGPATVTIGLGASGLVLATGQVIANSVATERSRHARRVSLVPSVSPELAGAAVVGRF